MKLKTLQRAKDEAIRFLASADQAVKANSWHLNSDHPRLKGEAYAPCKYVAAAKRASMDLTRVLADLRQGR